MTGAPAAAGSVIRPLMVTVCPLSARFLSAVAVTATLRDT